MRTTMKRIVSLLLTFVMVFAMLPMAAFASSDGPSDLAVAVLTEIYGGDENRARSDLEALYASGLIDSDGKMVALDVREGGKSVDLSELAGRINNGETVGEITINGNASSAEQIVQLSQVQAALEIASMLDEEIDATDEHAANLEELLKGIADGSVDMNGAIKSGVLNLTKGSASTRGAGDEPEVDLTLPENTPATLTISEDGKSYIAPYISGSTYIKNYPFELRYPDAEDKANYTVGYTGANPQANSATTENNARVDSFDWEKAVIGVDSYSAEPTVTVILPFKTDDSVQNWIASDFDAGKFVDISKNGIGVQMDLPGYGTANLKYYYKYMYFEYIDPQPSTSGYFENPSIRFPVYLVEDTSTGRYTAVATRFVAPANTGDHPRLDTLSLHVDRSGNPIGPTKIEWTTVNHITYVETNHSEYFPYLPDWSEKSTDAGGNYYWNMKECAIRKKGTDNMEYWNEYASPVPGRGLRYYIPSTLNITSDQYKIRPEGSWVQAKSGFIKLTNPENPEFPYVYPGNVNYPERQYDIELMVTKELYEAFAKSESRTNNRVFVSCLSDELGFVNDADYPWVVESNDWETCAKCGNARVNSTSSALTLKITLEQDATVSFDYCCETDEFTGDCATFSVDYDTKFSESPEYMQWTNYSCELSAGTHTLTWNYSKDWDDRFDAIDDGFKIKNFSIRTEGEITQPEDNTTYLLAKLYEGDDFNRVALRVSDRRNFSRGADGNAIKSVKWIPSGPNYIAQDTSADGLNTATLIPARVTPAENVFANINKLGYTLTPSVGSQFTKYVPVYLTVCDAEPFMMVPEFSRIRKAVAGLDTDMMFASNLAKYNKIKGGTVYNVQLYKIGEIDENDLDTLPADAQPVNVPDWGRFAASASNSLTHITIPGSALDSAGAYAMVITSEFSDGIDKTTFSAIAYLNVKNAPAKITLGQLSSTFVSKDHIPAITYTLVNGAESTEVKYTVQGTGENVSGMIDAAGGAINFTPDDFEGLKKAYVITVYARNNENDPWSVDSLLLTVYNNDILELLVKDVALGEIGGSTGGNAGNGVDEVSGGTINMDNSSKIEELLDNSGEGAGYQISGYDFDALRADVGLQRVISANYGSGVWGTISDRMRWTYKEADGRTSNSVTLNNKENGSYADLRNYSYTSYIPTTDFLIVATDDRSENAPVTITATHALTGTTKSVNVTVNTLKNKLYLFRFLPKVTTYVYYTNGNGDVRELHTNENGELIVYEPYGIASDVVTMSQSGGETYVGTIQNKSLVSGEKNIARLELYPCNNLNLVALSNQTVTFLKPDGTPYNGAVTLRAGIYKGGNYCPEYGVRITKDDEAQILRSDISLTAEDGVITLYYDPTQLMADNGLNRGLRYVYEYRIDGYQPGYTVINPLSKDPADFTVYLQAVRGSASAPQITRQEYQQYLNGTNPTSYKRNVIDSVENIGISPNYPMAKLYTDIALPNETVGNDANGYSTYEGENVVKFALYTANGTKLHGQTDLSSDSAHATQITNLSQLNNATYFVFPFSSVPMLRSTYTMTDADMRADGIDDIAKTPTARIKAVFTRGDLTVKTLNMPFGVTNVSNQPDLTSSSEGAAAVGGEVRDNLRETTDIGSIFRSINVNDMIRKGFVFLGNLTGAGGDNPINLMILPTQDPATFRVIAFVGANQRGGDDDDGVSVNFNADDLAEDINKFQEAFEDDDEEEDSGGEGSMTFNFYGTIILDVHAGVKDGKWSIAFRGGNVGANVKGKYEWGQTFMAGPVPVFISFEVGFHADLEVAFGNKSAARAMLLDAALGVSIEAFAGIGFDLSLVALQLGIYGKIGADVDFLLLTSSNESAKTGTKLTISGEIGIKFRIKVLFVSYTKTLASTGFNWTKKWNNYDQIKQYWSNQGYGQLFGRTARGRAYTMYLFADGSTMVAIDEDAQLESRDYLELAERAWNGGINRTRNASAITDIQTNAYPYSHPAFTDDGEMFLYISDNNNAEKAEGVTSYAVRNGAGYDDMGRVDTSDDNILSDLDVVASGTKDNAFAAWVKQIESPRMDKNAGATNDDLGMMFNATEVYAGIYNGTNWTTERLTDNNVADMAPTVASYGNRAIIAWRSMSASSMTAGADMTAAFDVENNINYRIYNGTEWTDAQIAYNGSAGTVNAIDSAMLSDGTAILTYTVRTGEDVATTETFYTVIGTDGNAVTTGRLTNDNYTDTNVQATAVNDPTGGYFVLGWYSEHDAGEGANAEYDENESAAEKAVTAHDIRLARINSNGSYDVDFPESIGGSSSSDITSDFHFSAPANNTAIENLSIVWSQRMDSDDTADAGKYELNAVRFFDLNGTLGVTAPTDIAQTAKNYTIDSFDVYTDGSGTVNAIILGSDYDSIEGISFYDSIDLNAAANNTVTDNSDSPNNLQILDGEAISSLKLAKGSFPEISAKVNAAVKITEVIPGLTAPVLFNVTNKGTGVLDTITASVGSQSKDFTVNLLPNQSTTLIINYSVPEGPVCDAEYSVTSSGTVLDSGTLTLNRPDVSIAGMKVLREENGERDIQIRLSNSYSIPFEGSGKTVKLALFKDPFYTNKIDEVTIDSAAELASIDAGTYRTVRTVDVSSLFDGDEIPDTGLAVYAKAWVEDTDEPNVYNNTSFVSFSGLLVRNDGRKFVEDSMLEVNGDGSYTVYTDIRNNSLQPTTVAVPVAVLLDSEGNVIAQKNLIDTQLELRGEQRRDDLTVTFTADEVEGTPVAAGIRHISIISFDVNGGEGEFATVMTDLDGHIVIPAGEPAAPVSNPQLFFRGWYTSADGGEKVTADYAFTENTTVYARYTAHEHEFSFSAEGDTVTATCVSTVNDICPLEDQGRKTTLTIVAPERAARNVGDPSATITGDTALLGTPEIRYYATNASGEKTGEALTEVPLAIGRYWAEFTLGEGGNSATAHVVYELTVEGSSSGQSSGTKVSMRDFVRVTDSNTAANMGYYDTSWFATAGDALYWIFSNVDLLNADTDMRKLVIYRAENERFYRFSFYEVGQDRMLFGEDVDVGDVAYNDIPYGDCEVYFPTFDSNEIKAASFTETTYADALYAALAAMPDGTDLDAASWMAANEDKLSEGGCLVVFSNSQGGYRFYSCNNSNIVGPCSTTSFGGVFDQIGKVYVINEVGTTGGQVDINQQFTLEYKANGGIGTLPAGGTFYYMSTVNVADGKGLYTNVGLVFDGWNTKADGTGDAYAPGDKFNINKNTTLYAQWKHVHSWSYSYNEESKVLTATCTSTCDLGNLTLHPEAVDKMYDGKNAKPYTCSKNWTEENGLTFPEVTYYKDGVEVAEAKNAGTYTAIVSIDGHDIKVGEFTVTPRPIVLIADDQTMYYGGTEPEFTVSYDKAGMKLRFDNDASYGWQIVNEDGRTYAKSGNAGAGDSTSTLTLTVTLAEAGTVSFDYKYGSEERWDWCYFRVDGSEKLKVSGDGETWRTFTCDLSAGTHTLTWAYSKDGGSDNFSDSFSVDNVQINTTGSVTQTEEGGSGNAGTAFEALNDSLLFINDASYPWQEETDGDRVYAKCGNTDQHNTRSSLKLSVTLENPGTVSFDYKYGSEGGFDWCYFTVDGSEIIKVSGEGNWQTYSYELSAGSHTLTWAYTKDGSSSADGDFFAIDNVVITAEGNVTQESSEEQLIKAMNNIEGGIVEGEDLNYTATHDEITGDGEYTITVVPGENPNYDIRNVVNGTLTVRTSQCEPQTITASDVTATYGDTGVKIEATTDGDGALSYAVKSGDAVTVDSEGNLTIVKAGSAVITVSAAQTDTYAPATKDVIVTVNPKTMTVAAEDVNASVNGQPHGITVTVTDPAVGYTVKYGTAEGTYDLNTCPTLTEAGTLTVYYQVTADNYETFTGSATISLTVTEFSPFDLDCSGFADIRDVTVLLNYLAGTNEYNAAFDLNDDEAVNINDVTSLLNHIATL